MYSEENKRNDEFVWASIFVSEINRLHGFDYTLHPEKREDTPVDMFLNSQSGKYPQLALQLTHAVELPFMAYEGPVSADYSKHPTIEAIERKHSKLQRQGADLSGLILVVQGYMNHDTARMVFADKAFEKFKTYPFKGIYYAAPPMLSGETSESLQDGYIVAIKEAFVVD